MGGLDDGDHALRTFMPMTFGKKKTGPAKVGIEAHDVNQRGDASRGVVTFGARGQDAVAALGAQSRAARAAARKERAAKAEAKAGVENGGAEAPPTGSLIPQEEEQAEAPEEPDELPEPGREAEVLPVSHEVSLPAHEKGVTALGLDPKACRMTTGSIDGSIKFYDFNGMTEAKNFFRELEPIEGHMVQATSFTCSGGIMLAVCSDAHARLYDRDGTSTPVQQTVKGDMYVRDLTHTQGHTQMLTDGVCHPLMPEVWLTASLDGTLRLWDINAKPVGMDQWLPSVHVLKCVDKRNVCLGGGAGRSGGLHPTCCAYSHNDGKKIVGGCTDGSIQMFFEKARYWRPDRIVRTAHAASVTSLAFVDGECNLLATRALDNTMKLWDCRMLSDAKGPVKVFDDLPAALEKTGVCASPDGKYLVTGTSFSSSKGGAHGGASLRVYDAKSFSLVKSLDFGKKSVLRIAWPREINQVVVGTSSGEVVMMYSPFSSKKGCLHFVGKKAKSKAATEIAGGQTAGVGPIFNMTDREDVNRFYTTGHGNMTKIRRHEARQSQKTPMPQRPSTITVDDHGGSFAAEVLKHGAKRLTMVEQDSQKALLAYADKAEKASKGGDSFITRAYQNSEPVKLLDYNIEMSEGDKRMAERLSGDFCRKCGQKMCRCVDYSIYGESSKSMPPGAKRMKPGLP
eukprot:TRINITY_DN31024_c0_g1_i1.p1 TRINITY_DN31024_c0_g1~~TRINITY_DN31024_c0_g1_i1.p1  ORF type:complete len:779 (+),score=187.68 TRINITY_DN31024_c0_g1_i1:297-2339(+)